MGEFISYCVLIMIIDCHRTNTYMNEWTSNEKQTYSDENMAKELRAFYKHTNLKVGSVCSDENEHYDRANGYITVYTSITAHNGPLRTESHHITLVQFITFYVESLRFSMFIFSVIYAQPMSTHIPALLWSSLNFRPVRPIQFRNRGCECVRKRKTKPNKLREKEKRSCIGWLLNVQKGTSGVLLVSWTDNTIT